MISDAFALSMAMSLAHGGFGALSLAMDRHQNSVLHRTLDAMPTLMCRCYGTVLLFSAAVPGIIHWGVPIGIVFWCGILTSSAVLLLTLLHYAPALVRYSTWFVPLMSTTLLVAR